MGTEVGTPSSRLSETTIGAELQEDPCSFEFFQAVSLLERLRAEMPAVGGF